MKQISIVKPVLKLALVGVTGLLVACGSSGSSTPADASISGTIFAAPVDGADVSVVDGSGNVVVEPVKTDGNGKYSLVIPNGSLGQALIIKSTGGTYTDEATGNPGITAGTMYSYVAANSISDGDSVSATPGSTIIAKIVMDPDTDVSPADASAVFAKAFGYTPETSITPVDVTDSSAVATASDESKLAGLRAAAFSQLAMDLKLMANQQFDMLDALTQDLSDGTLDGTDNSVAIAIGTSGKMLQANIQNRFATALVNFHDDGHETYLGRDLSGLTNAQIGDVPFAKIAFTVDDWDLAIPTSTYQIEYVQIGEMDAMAGKSTFTIRITEHDGTTPYTGTTPSLMPTMYMAMMNHSSPMPTTAIVPGSAAGEYTVTIYYLMASGMTMGFWDLAFTVENSEVAHLYPAVMMAMGDTLLVKLKGVTDQVMTMTGMADRTYYIFKESLMNMGGPGKYDFSVFIAAQETMMSFPAVYDGSTLSGNVVTDATVEISDDDGLNWKSANDSSSDGIWSVNGLSLTDGVADEIRVRLRIDSNGINELKTTDGAAAVADVNDYQTFIVTPGSM